MKRLLSFLIILFCILIITACSGKKIVKDSDKSSHWDSLEDIRKFPQDLMAYAKLQKQDTPLIDQKIQLREDEYYMRVFFGPWNMKKASQKKRAISSLFKKARGYKIGGAAWQQREWNLMLQNANLKTYPSKLQPAITIYNTNLREIPTHEYRFSEPTNDINENPFDLFQYSILHAGMPVMIVHTSNDGLWHYVECPIAGGWVAASDLAYVDESFMEKWKNNKFVAITKDNVQLDGIAMSMKNQGNIGMILPTVGEDKKTWQVLLPISGSGNKAEIKQISLPKNVAQLKPIVLTPKNAATIGNVMMGQRYGWGGTLGLRDCSALTRDMLAPFGIWIGRNSSVQAKTGLVINLDGLLGSEKEKIVLNQGIPFLSLVGLKGHITMYVGPYKGRPAIFHNIWGLRTVDGSNTNSRFVIGRAVVTSLTPGLDIENLYREKTFVDRLRSLSTPIRAIE